MAGAGAEGRGLQREISPAGFAAALALARVLHFRVHTTYTYIENEACHHYFGSEIGAEPLCNRLMETSREHRMRTRAAGGAVRERQAQRSL